MAGGHAGGVLGVFLITKPGNDLDGEEKLIEAESVEAALVRASALEIAYGYKLTFLGTRAGTVFTPALPYDALPWWAKQYVDEQAPRHTVRRERTPRVAKVKKPRATREDGIDYGWDRAMDRAEAADRKALRGGR